MGIDRKETRFFTTPLPNDGIAVTSIGDPDSDGIVQLNLSSSTTNRVLSGTHVTFHRPYVYSIVDPTTGNDKYQTIGRDPTSNIVFAKGKCINLSNQTTLGLKIRNKEKRLKSVKTELL